MPTATTKHQSLSRILNHEIEEIQILLDILREEYQLLQQTSPEPLEQLVKNKHQQIGKLEAFVKQQNALLEQLALPPNKQGMQSFMEMHASGRWIKDQWRQFEKLLDNCQKQNSINGSMIAQSRQQITHTLDLLHGVSSDHKTYCPSGMAQPHQTNNSLGKA